MSIFSIASFAVTPVARDRLSKRIQIHHDQFKGDYALGGYGSHVVGAVAAAEDAGVDFGVEGLDPAVHHLGKASVGGHLVDVDAGLFQVLAGAATGENFDTGRHEPLGELDKTRFIADADQRPLDLGRGHCHLPSPIRGPELIAMKNR